MKIGWILLVCSVLVAPLRAQGVAGSYLSVVNDARMAGMGQSGTATSADAFSVFRNASVTALSASSGELGYNFTPVLTAFVRDMQINSIGFFKNRKGFQAFTAGFRHFKAGSIPLADENGRPNGLLIPAEWDLSVGYSHAFADCFSTGLTARFIHSDLGEAITKKGSSAVAFDFSSYYQKELGQSNLLAVGLTISNVGSKLSLGDHSYSLPSRIEIGASYDMLLSDRVSLNWTASGGYRFGGLDRAADWGTGAECWLYKVVAVRMGYHGMNARYRRNVYALGVGALFNHIYADFAYYLPLSEKSAQKRGWSLSVGINFDLFRQLQARAK